MTQCIWEASSPKFPVDFVQANPPPLVSTEASEGFNLPKTHP